jgi:NAD(P)-dependent dehydrogenase (short-subunit alcohol dehydrogenase family)
VSTGPGTGQALGAAFSRSTDAVALLARNPDTLQGVAQSIQKEGAVAEPFACDVSSPESLSAAFKAVREKFPTHQLKV